MKKIKQLCKKFKKYILKKLNLVEYSKYKKAIDELNQINDVSNEKFMDIFHNKQKYAYSWTKCCALIGQGPITLYRFAIYVDYPDGKTTTNIKFISTDDFEYGELCAKEICDFLNQNMDIWDIPTEKIKTWEDYSKQYQTI